MRPIDPATGQIISVTQATTVTLTSSDATKILLSPNDTTTSGAGTATQAAP